MCYYSRLSGTLSKLSVNVAGIRAYPTTCNYIIGIQSTHFRNGLSVKIPGTFLDSLAFSEIFPFRR
ncbi:hypothetical protein DPMN_102508 [Dreissena polymorpha]|uniref:Uncharacterized protein n=1 Tax=Dreissena polymorpha TaxID=45954 RepID=A0A9D4LJG5_DREPO|nr:hypothetical protein DPMN_102508 [Dreissena polymorpha]